MAGKSAVLIPALLLLLTSCSPRTEPAEAEQGADWQHFAATAYSIEGQTASGKQTREGRTIAADHSILPLGTSVEIKDAGVYDGVYLVQDSGPKVKGNQIDIFIDDPGEAKRFGNKKIRLRVIK